MTSRHRLVAALVTVALAAGACSGSDGASAEAYCLRLDELVRLDDALLTADPSDVDATERGLAGFARALADVRADAPDAIVDDLDTVSAWTGALVDAYTADSEDDLSAAVRFQRAIEGLTDPTEALARVRAHARGTCGFDLDETP